MEIVVPVMAGSPHRERQRAAVVRNTGISDDSFGTVEKHFGRNRSVDVDRHLAELRVHPIVTTAFTKNRVRQVIGHGKHRLTIAKHEVLGIHELARVMFKYLQTLLATHFTRLEIQALPRGIVARLLAVHENGKRLLQPIDGDASSLQLGKDFANHGLFHFVVVRGNKAVTVFQAMILINPVTLQAGYRIGNGVSILNVFLGVFLGEHGHGQQDQDGGQRQRSLTGISSSI